MTKDNWLHTLSNRTKIPTKNTGPTLSGRSLHSFVTHAQVSPKLGTASDSTHRWSLLFQGKNSLGSAFTKPNGKPCKGRARPSEVVYVTWAERVRRTAIGYSSLPEVVCCKSCFGSESSKGNLPQTIVYKTTPRLQTSLAIPSYGIPIRQQKMPIKNCNSWKVLNRGVLHF